MLPRPRSIEDAWRLVERLPSDCRIGDLPGRVAYVTGNKGWAGRMLESALGLPGPSGDAPDFEDGDLKTYAARPDGTALYPVQVAQVTSANVDELLHPAALPFEASRIHLKTQRLLLVGIAHGETDQRDSRIVTRMLVDARPGTAWFERLATSYEHVVRLLNESIRVGRDELGLPYSMGHGRLAGEWLHIRGKDSRPYTPVFSDLLEQEVSSRQLGFYFEQAFVKAALEGQGGTLVLR